MIGTYDHTASATEGYLTEAHPSMISRKCGDYVVLYKLDYTEDKDHSPGITLTIRLLMDLSIRVFLCGRKFRTVV